MEGMEGMGDPDPPVQLIHNGCTTFVLFFHVSFVGFVRPVNSRRPRSSATSLAPPNTSPRSATLLLTKTFPGSILVLS
jgi:hypothetical protein